MMNYKILILLLLPILCYSQSAKKESNNAVTFVIKEKGQELNMISYPPGTTAKVIFQNNDEEISLADEFDEIFNGSLTLIVDPPYTKNFDEFKIKGELKAYTFNAKLSNYEGIMSYHKGDDNKNSKSWSNIEVEKELIPSEINPGDYNMVLKFENGLVFKYTDGKAEAILENEPQRIEGKYVIDTYKGIARISYNPSNGVTWYVFEPKHP